MISWGRIFATRWRRSRRKAYRELYRVYEQNAPVLGQIYLHRVRDWNAEAVELRGYTSPISARNLSNDLPDAVVDTLLEVCRKNAGLFQRYFQLKARWLGVPSGTLSRYDLYAPLAEFDKTFALWRSQETGDGELPEFLTACGGPCTTRFR